MAPTTPCDPSRWQYAGGPPRRSKCASGSVRRSSTPKPPTTFSPSLSHHWRNGDLRFALSRQVSFTDCASMGIPPLGIPRQDVHLNNQFREKEQAVADVNRPLRTVSEA